jgi:hypothetical protein
LNLCLIKWSDFSIAENGCKNLVRFNTKAMVEVSIQVISSTLKCEDQKARIVIMLFVMCFEPFHHQELPISGSLLENVFHMIGKLSSLVK